MTTPPTVDYIAIDYTLGKGAKITAVDVWDGDMRIYQSTVNLVGTGSKTAYLAPINPPKQISQGLVICFDIQGGPTQAQNLFKVHAGSARIQATFS
jgi:hypothetical protein